MAIAALAFGCMNVPDLLVHVDETPDAIEDACAIPGPFLRNVDLVFLIDTSLSMADEQVQLQRNFPAMIGALRKISGGLPNLHMGVITPDLGTSPYNIPGCERPGGDGGRFLKGINDSCMNPINQKYVVDVEPRGCTIRKTNAGDAGTTCDSHDCTQANCDVAAFTGLDGVATEPADLVFATDPSGCPRCRNYTNQTLEEVFQCMAAPGINGCGMEQPLEALKQALTGLPSENRGFMRNDAMLAIFILSDEDDCSAKQAELFNPQGDINSTLGPLTSFRCTEFGVKCDQPWQRVMPQGQLTYTHCRPRESNDPKNMLHPISEYTNTLSQLKESSMIIVGAIAGPYEDSLIVGTDDNDNPRLLPSCGSVSPDDGQGAVPAVRLKSFVESFEHRPEDTLWMYTSLCAMDFTPALLGLADRVRTLAEDVTCLSKPLRGCPDPAFAFGEGSTTDLPTEIAERCVPGCTVSERDSNGVEVLVQHCPGNYAGGHPPRVDPDLPLYRCWHVQYNPQCALACTLDTLFQGCEPDTHPWYGPSRGAEIVISRRPYLDQGPPPTVSCPAVPLTERLCFNGLDDDVDGRIDADDPDCQ
ncbi:MAG: hypothetical protein CVU65_00290 [Deltaproteobacteria bacterium HGW-Deltaproteobacteria-22]|nr:MAG: hypothetical protein CVU65_00290 [Deltaproteobacteria bacterium HGW-Deltaproteobacteria-22]